MAYYMRPVGIGQGDGLGSWLKSAGKAIVKVTSAVLKPALGIAAAVIPGGALVKYGGSAIVKGVQAAGKFLKSPAGSAIGGAIGGMLVSGGPLKEAPSYGGGFPAAPPSGGGGLRDLVPFWKGPGGKFQMPWSDPKQMFQPPFAYDDSYLRPYYKAPRGYVVVRDAEGRPYAMMKMIAQRVGLWHAARKPPISAGDWHMYQTGRRVEKRLQKLARHAMAHRGHRAPQNVVHFKRKAA